MVDVEEEKEGGSKEEVQAMYPIDLEPETNDFTIKVKNVSLVRNANSTCLTLSFFLGTINVFSLIACKMMFGIGGCDW